MEQLKCCYRKLGTLERAATYRDKKIKPLFLQIKNKVAAMAAQVKELTKEVENWKSILGLAPFWGKVEKLKKKNKQTKKFSFTEGKKLDELHKAVEVGKRPYQNILKVIISAGVTAMICFLIGVLMHVFLN